MRGANPPQFDAARGRHRRPPARLDHRGRIAFGENRRTVDASRPARRPRPGTGAPSRQPAGASSAKQYMRNIGVRGRLRHAGRRQRPARGGRVPPVRSGGDAFHRHRLDHQRLIRHQKGEAAAIGRARSLAYRRHGVARPQLCRGSSTRQCRVGALVADVQRATTRAQRGARLSPCASSSAPAFVLQALAAAPPRSQASLESSSSRSSAASRIAI